MKVVALLFAIGGMCDFPSTALSATSHGAHTLQLVQGMDTYCEQARKDSVALQIPMEGELAKLCS